MRNLVTCSLHQYPDPSSVALQSLKGLTTSHTGGFLILDTWWNSFGWAINPPQRPVPTQKDEDKHPCFNRDSNPRSHRPCDKSLRFRLRGHWTGFIRYHCDQNVMGWACSTHGGDEKFIHTFGCNTRSEDTTWKILVQVIILECILKN
jgi:hypothetical protein